MLLEVRAQRPDALYFAGRYQVGLKLARQVAEILPSVHRLAAESLYDGAFPLQAGSAAAEGWHVSNVAPDVGAGPAALSWAERFRARFGDAPSPYALSAYTAVLVIADAVARVVGSGQPVTRTRVRDAIQTTRLPSTPQGPSRSTTTATWCNPSCRSTGSGAARSSTWAPSTTRAPPGSRGSRATVTSASSPATPLPAFGPTSMSEGLGAGALLLAFEVLAGGSLQRMSLTADSPRSRGQGELIPAGMVTDPPR